jgi:hypothetical protein
MLNHFYDWSEKEITDNLRTRFLLAQLLMDSFRDKLTVRDVKSALQNLPQGSDAYDVAYHAAMERIFAQGKGSSKMAKKILAWILCANRPLSTLELLHALAVEPEDTEIDEDNIMEAEQLLTICAGLVTIDEQSDSVRFIHYTTQDYLQRNQQRWLPQADFEVARACTTYLSMNGLAIGPCPSREDYHSRLKKFALLSYAAENWGPHMEMLVGLGCFLESGDVVIEALAFLSNIGCLGAASQALYMSERRYYLRSTFAKDGQGFSGSHWIARFRLVLSLREWVSRR